jgi:hypothetical protein
MTKLIGLHIDLEEKLEEICWRFLWIKWNWCIWTCMHLQKSLEMIAFFLGGPYIIFILVWWRHYVHVWIVLCEPFAKENCTLCLKEYIVFRHELKELDVFFSLCFNITKSSKYSYQSNSCDFQSLNILNYLCFYLGPQMCKKVASFKLEIPIWFLIDKLINAWQLDIDLKESKYPMGVFQVYILLGVSNQLCHKKHYCIEWKYHDFSH